MLYCQHVLCCRSVESRCYKLEIVSQHSQETFKMFASVIHAYDIIKVIKFSPEV